MDLEILTDQRASRWIDDEPLLSPPVSSSRLQTGRVSSTLQTPKPPGLNKSIFSRRVSQETEAESVGLLHSEPNTLSKIHNRAKSEMALSDDHFQINFQHPKPLNLENIHESLHDIPEGEDLKLSTIPINSCVLMIFSIYSE